MRFEILKGASLVPGYVFARESGKLASIFYDKEAYGVHSPATILFQWNPDFTNLQGKRKLVRKIREFEKSGIKLKCSNEEGKRLLVGVIARFEKLRVREIGMPLQLTCHNGET